MRLVERQEWRRAQGNARALRKLRLPKRPLLGMQVMQFILQAIVHYCESEFFPPRPGGDRSPQYERGRGRQCSRTRGHERRGGWRNCHPERSRHPQLMFLGSRSRSGEGASPFQGTFQSLDDHFPSISQYSWVLGPDLESQQALLKGLLRLGRSFSPQLAYVPGESI
jgi:hypothetical protein